MNLSRSPFAQLTGCVVVMLALGSLGGCDDDPASTPTPTAFAGCRGAHVDLTVAGGLPQTLPPFALSDSGARPELRTRVVLTNLPAVAQQGTAHNPGSPGTCEAQSFGYGLGSYTAARLPDGSIKWDAAEPANSVSAAFLYTLSVREHDAGPCPSGGVQPEYLMRLTAVGAPSRAQVPYEPHCKYLNGIDTRIQWPDQGRFRIGSFSSFELRPGLLDFIRQLLAAGHAVAFTGLVYQDYDDPRLQFGVFGSNTNDQPDTIPNSGHGQLLVGYDDAKGDPSAPGAFLVQNSFGPAWPPSEANADGRVWWAYETFFDSQVFASVAYPRAESVPLQGKLESTLARPEGFVTGVHHWVDTRDTSIVYLIVELQFTEPVHLESIVITEPTTGTTVRQEYRLPFSTGYVFTGRTDGAQFVHGSWQIGITVEFEGSTGEYGGIFDVGQSVPTAPPPLPAAAPMFGTTDETATVTVGSG